jgi:Mg-chelatase subunit ChlD
MSKKELIRLGTDGLVVGENRKPVQTFKPGWVMLVVDTSQSMSSFPNSVNPHLNKVKCSQSVVVDGLKVSVPDDDEPPLQGRTALDIARAEAIEFANKARTQRYLTGLVAFDDDAKIIRSPEEKIPFVESAAALQVGGGTNMTAGIFVASTTLQQAPGEKAMVIISDGLPNDEEKTIRAANNAKRLGVRIITIGVPGANEGFLKQIASDSDLATITDFAQLGDAMGKAINLLPPPRTITRKG